MRIGIHQPNFLPWMGYFHKIAQSDTFVFLNHVEYTKNSFTKRVKIHKVDNWEEEQYITVPLKKHSDHAAINSLQIVGGDKWQKKIRAQVYQSYHKAPYFYQIEPLLERFFEQPIRSASFSEFTIEIIKYVAELLNITPTWVLSSELEIEYKSTDVNLDILTFLNGTTYLSGMGAKKYQDHQLFEQLDIELKYSDFLTKFTEMNIPKHYFNKSIIGYLSCFPIDILKEVLSNPSS